MSAGRIAGRPPDLAPGQQVVSYDDGDGWEQSARLEYQVFNSLGYCSASSSGLVEEYAPWRSDSVFYSVVDQSNQVLGVVRSISGVFEELPVGKLPLDSAAPEGIVCEFASVAIGPQVRGDGFAQHLYRACWVDARRAGAVGLAAAVEQWRFELLRDYFGFPFEALGAATRYMGGDILPIAGTFKVIEPTLAATRPNLYHWFVEGFPDSERRELGLPE